MTEEWPRSTPGIVELPSGLRVRGRSLKTPPGDLAATWSVRLGLAQPADLGPGPGESIRWRDFWLPAAPYEALAVLSRALHKAESDRVEVGCPGGVGRTGTALAAMAVLEGEEPDRALARVRANYHPRAVEVPWQGRFLRLAAHHRRDSPPS